MTSTRQKTRRRRGAALVMVMGAIAILTVYLTEVQQDSSAALSAAIAERDTLKAEYHARSAVNLARLLIATEPTVRRAIAPIFMMMKRKPPQIPVWAFAHQVLGMFNDAEGNEAFKVLTQIDTSTGLNLGLGGDGHFEVAVVDEDSKVNVNVASRGDVISQSRLMAQLIGLMAQPQYNAMFEQEDADGQFSNRSTICGALIDWADSDETLQACDVTAQGPVTGGTEDNFYQVIGLPYLRKNAPYDSLEELRLVRGVGDDFWATFVEPEPNEPDKRVMTVWGQGKINVNTANAQTLLALVCAGAPEALLCLDPLQTQAFIMGVTLARSFTMGAPLFGSAKDFITTMKGAGMVGPLLATLGVTPVVFKSDSEMASMITTESKMFSIYADGVTSNGKRETRVRIHAVVDFRQATDLPSVMSLLGGDDSGGGTDSERPPPPAAPAESLASGQELTAEQLAAAVGSNPAGKMVYWRLQ